MVATPAAISVSLVFVVAFFSIMGVILVGIVAMIGALVDCVRRPDWAYGVSGQSKLVWIVLLLFTGLIGAVIYWAWLRPKLIAIEATGFPAAGPWGLGYPGPGWPAPWSGPWGPPPGPAGGPPPPMPGAQSAAPWATAGWSGPAPGSGPSWSHPSAAPGEDGTPTTTGATPAAGSPVAPPAAPAEPDPQPRPESG